MAPPVTPPEQPAPQGSSATAIYAARSSGAAGVWIHAIAVAPDRDSLSEPDHDRAIAPRPPDRQPSLPGARENLSVRHSKATAARRRRNRNRGADRLEKTIGRRRAASVMRQGKYFGTEIGATRNEIGFCGRLEISR